MDAPIIERRVQLAQKRSGAGDGLATRVAGVALLGVCALAALRLHASAIVWPHHPPSPTEMLLSLVTVLTGMAGAMTSLIGPALFRSGPR